MFLDDIARIALMCRKEKVVIADSGELKVEAPFHSEL
jgi:hypothetical protein